MSAGMREVLRWVIPFLQRAEAGAGGQAAAARRTHLFYCQAVMSQVWLGLPLVGVKDLALTGDGVLGSIFSFL